MRTAIDSNVISAIWTGEPGAPKLIERLSLAKSDGALLICPVVFSELYAYPGASEAFLYKFLKDTEVDVDYLLQEQVWAESGRRFARYAARRRISSGAGPRRLVADFLIGAHALLQADRLMTLDPKVYQQDFPELQLIQ